MSLLQVLANLGIAIIVVAVIGFGMSKAPAFELKDFATFLFQFVGAVLVFVYNAAARFGVK